MTAGFLRLVSEEMQRTLLKKGSIKNDPAFIQQFYFSGSKRKLILGLFSLRSTLAVHFTKYWHMAILTNMLFNSMKQNKTIKNALEVKEKYICNCWENLGVKILSNQKKKRYNSLQN